MSEEPQKRLVRMKEYVGVVAGKGILSSTAYVFLSGGVLLLVAGIPSAILGGLSALQGHLDGTSGLVMGALLSALGFAGIYKSTKMFARIEKIEPVALLTKENAKHLPETETLVRASDLPPTHQQTELLRAVRDIAETPPEQLLRATQESRQDV